MSPDDLQVQLSDMHSKGTSLSCAVVAAAAATFLDQDCLETLEVMLGHQAWAKTDRFTRLVNALLTAGAQMAIRTPDVDTLLPFPD